MTSAAERHAVALTPRPGDFQGLGDEAVTALRSRDRMAAESHELTTPDEMTAKGGQAGAVTICLADVTPERVDWLWPARLPLGKIVVLDGDPSVGKSTLAIDWAARVSTGQAWPDDATNRLGSVLILSAEDGLADTIRPRLAAAGGDPNRVHALTEASYFDEDGTTRAQSVTLANLACIEQAVEKVGALLVVIDVLMAYMPGKVDSHRDQDVRGVLAGLAAMAERRGCCVLLLRHLNKTSGGSALYRGGGSIGIIGAARVGLLAAHDPEDETRRVLAATKCNLASLPEALAYELVDSPEHGCAAVRWLGATDHRAEDLLAKQGDDQRVQVDAAGDWLIAYLTGHGGEVSAAQATSDAARDGITKTTLYRARKRCGVTTQKSGVKAGWTWRLDS